MNAIYETHLSLPLVGRGKVRDIYDLGEHLLLVSTDRLSAFDVVFKEPIPHKGEVLNSISKFWFDRTKHIIENHLVSDSVPSSLGVDSKRAMVVKKAKPVMLECVVRGYLTGSGLKEYKEKQSVCGIPLPSGLKDGSELHEPLFTPSTKAPKGQHDQNITLDEAIKIIGKETFEIVKQKSLELYKFGKAHALKCGLVLADTKFEFGVYQGKVILIDEALTPDSSRYWLKSEYEKGKLVSLDKQYVRDYLEKLGWNKSPPPPALPGDVIEHTSKRYLESFRMLTGRDLA